MIPVNDRNITRTAPRSQALMVEQPEHPGSGVPHWLYCQKLSNGPQVTLLLGDQALAMLSDLSLEEIGALVLFGVIRATAPSLPWHASIVAVAEHGHAAPDKRTLELMRNVLRRCALANRGAA
jgi:hypothetical protein